MTKMHLPLAHTLLFLLFLASTLARSEEDANLAGFDEESQGFIRSQQSPNSFSVFRWLMPFCSDLSPYLEREDFAPPKSTKHFGGTPKYHTALWASWHFQERYLPDGWTAASHTLKDWVPNTPAGGTRYYKRVPNTICPVETWPCGTPVSLRVWEHRKGDVKISMLYSISKSRMLIVAHKDGGLGVPNPTGEQLRTIAIEYFHLPPVGLRVPKDWEPVFEIEGRTKRFCSGKLFAKYSDESDQFRRLDYPLGVASWGRSKGNRGAFFYDGFNLALFVSPIKGGEPAVDVSEPHDMDWDLIEKMRKEYAEKRKSQSDAPPEKRARREKSRFSD